MSAMSAIIHVEAQSVQEDMLYNFRPDIRGGTDTHLFNNLNLGQTHWPNLETLNHTYARRVFVLSPETQV